MKYVQLVFSPTGGTEKVANTITKNWPSVEKVDLSVFNENYSQYAYQADDVVLIAMPSFAGLAPQVALDRLTKIKGNAARCILVAVYGNRAYEDTLVQMEDAAEACGFNVIAAIAAIAEHSIMHQYATGRPGGEDEDQLALFADKIKVKTDANDFTKPTIPGNRPYKKPGASSLIPKADSSCTACGLCADLCPVQAIDSQAIDTADSKTCISCMRCIAVCPHGARKINSIIVSAAALALKKVCSKIKPNELFI